MGGAIQELDETPEGAGPLDVGDRANLHGADFSVTGVLNLVGTASGGEVLMALGPGPLRTEDLARQLHHVSERSVYRYSAKLTERDLVDRLEKGGVPSTVILSLTEPAGRTLYRLLERFAGTSMAHLPSPGNSVQSWSSLNLFSQLWGSGFVERLSHEPQTLTQLAGGPHGLTFHQVTRRMRLFNNGGLLLAHPPNGRGKRYGLSEHGRRRMALVAGLGRWRHRYVHTGEPTGLTVAEMATVLRAALPLILLPEFAGTRFDLGVASPVDEHGHRTVEVVQGVIGDDGTIRCDLAHVATVDGSTTGTMNTWLAALLDGTRGRMRTGGNLPLVNACLAQLHEVLWESPPGPPA